MTAWELAWLIEGLELGHWSDKRAASSEARLQHCEVIEKSIALRQRSYASMHCKDIHRVLVS